MRSCFLGAGIRHCKSTLPIRVLLTSIIFKLAKIRFYRPKYGFKPFITVPFLGLTQAKQYLDCTIPSSEKKVSLLLPLALPDFPLLFFRRFLAACFRASVKRARPKTGFQFWERNFLRFTHIFFNPALIFSVSRRLVHTSGQHWRQNRLAGGRTPGLLKRTPYRAGAAACGVVQ
jgi:hypothetical protein